MKPAVPRVQERTEAQTFYHFLTLSPDDVRRVEAGLYQDAKELGIVGLIILGEAGLNATASGPSRELRLFVERAGELLSPRFRFLNIKSSWVEPGEKLPFLDFVVKVRPEIVTLKRTDLLPHDPNSQTHLSPQDWHEQLQAPGAIVIDTRNTYESVIGTFRGALTPEIEEFSEFPEWLDKTPLDKSAPTYIFCTGGIRCEKAIRSLEEKGFEKVYQLDGGILNYINQFPKSEKPESLWDGECFVFDNRIAVDGSGRASQKYTACPHCGQPAQHAVFCVRCDSPATLCDSCYEAQAALDALTCSKNCAHHWHVSPGKKGRPQVPNSPTRGSANR